jgi:outer membrane biosynthesis protein TonB
MREYSQSRSRLGRSGPIRSWILSAFALAALAACGDKQADTNLASDSALGRDLALAQRDSASQPQLQDVPTPPPAPTPTAAPAPTPAPRPPRPTPRPAASTPTPAPVPAPAPAKVEMLTGTVAAGTSLRFAANDKVCSNSTAVGEKFTATLSDAVNATNGVRIPEGATGTFEVIESKSAQNAKDETYLRVKLTSVQFGGKTYPVESTVQTASTERIRSATKGTDAKKVAGGAIIGAIAGQIIGKNTKGTVIGAAAGAAAGTAAAAATANYDTCLGSGASVVVVLDAPVTVRPAPTP